MFGTILGRAAGTWDWLRHAIKFVRDGGMTEAVRAARALAAELQRIYRDGGITVETRAEAKDGGAVVARLVIQPDGDMVHLVTQDFLDDAEIQEKHWRCVDEMFAVFRQRSEAVTRAIVIAAQGTCLLVGLGSAASAASTQSWWLVGAGTVLTFATPWAAKRLLRWRLRRLLDLAPKADAA
jgi:hypothetical protein